jgi:carbon monoxide dehydrogenase subunit G
VKITEVIEVDRTPGQVWELFCNVQELSLCLPGAQLNEDRGDGTYAGNVSAKLGPMSTNFVGECTIVSDNETMTGSVKGKGTDSSGGSVGLVQVDYAVEDNGGGTRITIDADVTLSGAVAQFGRTAIIQEMSTRLITEFVECIEAKLEAESPEEAHAIHAGEVKGVSLFFSSLWATIRSWFDRGGSE